MAGCHQCCLGNIFLSIQKKKITAMTFLIFTILDKFSKLFKQFLLKNFFI